MGVSTLLPLLLSLALGPVAPGSPPASLESPSRRPAEDLRGALARLQVASSLERRSAERWLAENLDASDLGVLAEAAAELGLEGRARLAAAIGSDDRHFALGALLASERDPDLRRLGEVALLRMQERRWDTVELEPVPPAMVHSALSGNFSDRLLSMEIGRLAFTEELAAAVRNLGIPEGLPGAGPIAVVLDPRLYATGLKRPSGPSETLTRSPEQLLFAVVESHGSAVCEGFAMDGPRAGLHVVHRGNAGARSGSELILDWCRDVVTGSEGTGPGAARAEGAARALASLAWPAALDWLAWRWEVLGDRHALSGLLVSAERGRVAPTLARPDSVLTLLSAADEALARGQRLDLRFAEEVMRALGTMGGLSSGGDLAELVARDFDAVGTRSQRLRLGVLASLRRVPEELSVELRARLEQDTDLDGELALDMVRALAHDSLGARSFEWRDPSPAFEQGLRPTSHRVLDHWLTASGARPPADWRDPGVIVSDRPVVLLRSRLALWWLAEEGDLDVAAAHLDRLVGVLESSRGVTEAAAGDVLARLAQRGRRELLVRCFNRAREASNDPEGLERLALLAGVLDPVSEEALFNRLVADGVQEADLQILGVLAAAPDTAVGASARSAFLRYLAEGGAQDRDDPPWVPALSRALQRLRAADVPRGVRQRAEEEFLFGLRGELRESSHPAAQGLASGRWPRTAGLEPELL